MSTLVTLENTTTATLKRVKQILVLANNSYHSLNTSNSWDFPSGHHAAREFKNPPKCFNFGEPHLLPNNKKLRDEGKISRNRNAHMEKVVGKGNGPRMAMEVMVTKSMIIQIMATAVFR